MDGQTEKQERDTRNDEAWAEAEKRDKRGLRAAARKLRGKAKTRKAKTRKATGKPKAKAPTPEPVKLTAAEVEAKRQERLAAKRVNPCLCGCGTKVARHFAQGHDQRMRGFVLRVETGTATEREIAAVKAAVKAGVLLAAGPRTIKPNARLISKVA